MTANFASLIEATARRLPGKPALVWHGGAMSYAGLDARASGFARRLEAQGVRPGDRIALSLPNHWSFAAAALAGLKLGATVAPLDPLLKAEERAAILADLKPALLVEAVHEADDAWSTVAAPAAPALILYTSGSTGRPKGAVLSHAAVASANASWAGPVMRLTPDDVVLATLPLAHSFGLNGALFAPLLAGATVVLGARFAPEAVGEALAVRRVSVFPGVATMFRRLLDLPGFAAAGPGRLRLAVSGAAPCPWELAEAWRARTGVRMVRGYGITELFRPISYLADEAIDLPDSVGRAVPGVEIRVVDEAGFIRITGRKRERLLRGGHSVFPPEVEAVLLTHPAVAEVAVIAVSHPDLGEEVAAFVTLRPDARARPEELVAHSRERLAAFKYPRQVTILDALPRSATGKILKSQLR